jgi:hypothetical protein
LEGGAVTSPESFEGLTFSNIFSLQNTQASYLPFLGSVGSKKFNTPFDASGTNVVKGMVDLKRDGRNCLYR